MSFVLRLQMKQASLAHFLPLSLHLMKIHIVSSHLKRLKDPLASIILSITWAVLILIKLISSLLGENLIYR
jgi:hypothetical protein